MKYIRKYKVVFILILAIYTLLVFNRIEMKKIIEKRILETKNKEMNSKINIILTRLSRSLPLQIF